MAALALGAWPASASTPPLSERVLGNPDAPVALIEYASLTCDHCKRFHVEILPRLKETYIDTGKVKLVYRHFPFDQVAMTAAILTECVPRLRFFGLIEVLNRSHDGWAHSQDPKAGLAQIGLLAGVSRAAFEACLADDKLSTAIAEEFRTGQLEYKVNSTPTFIIGDTVLRGVRSYDEMAKVIDKAIDKAAGR
ncbi:MAG: DsbA family protein [Reyranella sp.]